MADAIASALRIAKKRRHRDDGGPVDDPFAIAALRLQQAQRPTGGRQESEARPVFPVRDFNGQPVTDRAPQDYLNDLRNPDTRAELIDQTAPVALSMSPGPSKGIKAYHGSPYDFDRFDLNKIGTGEGAQSYGHGLYFAENEGVARAYRDSLTGNVNAVNPRPQQAYQEAAKSFLGAGRSPEETLAGLKQAYQGASPAELEQAIRYARGLEKGRMYEVNINAHPDQFLDWDKALAQHSEAARDAVLGVRYGGDNAAVEAAKSNPEYMDRSVRALFYDLSHPSVSGSPAAATEALREAGIPGIKYLDQGSRAAGDGSRNYVVFDDKLVDILRKYGIAALSPLGMAAMSGHDDQQFADGGRVHMASGGDPDMSDDPFERAATRQRRAVMPAGGRQETELAPVLDVTGQPVTSRSPQDYLNDLRDPSSRAKIVDRFTPETALFSGRPANTSENMVRVASATPQTLSDADVGLGGSLSDADVGLSSSRPGFVDQMTAAVTDIPQEMRNDAVGSASTIIDKLNPFSDARRQALIQKAKKPVYEQLRDTVPDTLRDLGETGRGLLAIPEMITSPITGTARSLLGHPYSAITGIPYDKAKDTVDLAMMALRPSGRAVRVPASTPPVRRFDHPTEELVWERPNANVPSQPPIPNAGPLDVTLSNGQLNGDLPAIRREQAALRGQLGPEAQERAQAFADQQRAQVADTQGTITSDLDPFGQTVADTPQQAGQYVSDAVQRAAAQRKAAVGAAYDEAKNLPGEVEASAFDDIGQRIKENLSNRPDPVIIDDKLTPHASMAIQDIEQQVGKLDIQNRAQPESRGLIGAGEPPPTISGVTLQGVDQIRRRLSTFRKNAYSSGNASDGRAAQAVLDAFDNHIDQAVNGGLFNGDPRAVQAWNDARSAHADYRRTFTSGKNDPIGRVVEKIVGRSNNPAAIPNDVADFIYGASGINPSSLNVGVANRVKGILGDKSPEWSAVKQGLFSRLVEPGPGVTEWGPGKIAQRLNKFLNADGVELSKAIFSDTERATLQRYADLQRALDVPQTGAGWSGSQMGVIGTLKKIGGLITAAIGAGIAHSMGIPTGAAEVMGLGTALGVSKVDRLINARKIAKQMPLVTEAVKQWQKAQSAAARANAPLSKKATVARAAIATNNLVRALEGIGIGADALRSVQGPMPVRADDKQQ